MDLVPYNLPPCPSIVDPKHLNKTITRFEEFVIIVHDRGQPVSLNLNYSHLSRMGKKMLLRSGDINTVSPHHIYGTFRFFQLADHVTFTDNDTTVVWKDNGRRMVSNLVA